MAFAALMPATELAKCASNEPALAGGRCAQCLGGRRPRQRDGSVSTLRIGRPPATPPLRTLRAQSTGRSLCGQLGLQRPKSAEGNIEGIRNARMALKVEVVRR